MDLSPETQAASCEGVGQAISSNAGLVFQVASSLREVLDAWEMVYTAYRSINLIDPNPQRVHTAPHAVGPHAAVLYGSIQGLPVSTMTAMLDNASGLPLDRVYGSELQTLRRAGRRLLEVGLFADRRRQLSRSAEALLQLMRYAFHYGLTQGVTDFVIGVHPRHSRFYIRSFGFQTVGATKTYPAVNDHPVVLLRGDLESRLQTTPLHPALDFFVRNPVDPEVFASRFRFDPHVVAASPIGEFLRERASQGAVKAQIA